MTRATETTPSEQGQYALHPHPLGQTIEVSATGPDRGTTLAAAMTGITAAILGHEPPSPVAASVAVPLRADGEDFPALVPALAASLLDGLEEDPALIGPIRIDGILRTDEGLTAWGYMLTSSTPMPRGERFAVDTLEVNDEEGAVTIRLRLTRDR